MLSTLIQLAGFVALVVAAALVTPVAGFAVAGVSLLAIGHAADGITVRLPRRRKS